MVGLMTIGSRLLIPLSALVLGMMPPDAVAEPITRVDQVPGGGFVGDTWTFRCPAGGAADVQVDTFIDVPFENSVFASALDPVIEVYDGRGNLVAQADDELQCTALSICEAGCPGIRFRCGTGIRHSITVRDAGVLVGCSLGGSYSLLVEVFNAAGSSRPQREVKLGGGVSQNVPRFILQDGLIGRAGPVINNGAIPIPPLDAAVESAGASSKAGEVDATSKLGDLTAAVK